MNIPEMGTVRIIMHFADYAGKHVLPCHVLEHGDNNLMGRFDVVPYHPVLTQHCEGKLMSMDYG